MNIIWIFFGYLSNVIIHLIHYQTNFAIRDAFQTTFENIEAKGCVFHYTKAILGKVTKSGFKSDNENCPKFSAFVRAIFSLAYVPLSRLAEAVRNLYLFAKACESDRQIKFCSVMIKYICGESLDQRKFPSQFLECLSAWRGDYQQQSRGLQQENRYEILIWKLF